LLLHLRCLLDDFPEIGAALELARRHGEAIRDGNGW
jgi:hypothetical protein